MVGIKIARAHDASGIDNILVYIGQTIPEAGTVKGLISVTDNAAEFLPKTMECTGSE